MFTTHTPIPAGHENQQRKTCCAPTGCTTRTACTAVGENLMAWGGEWVGQGRRFLDVLMALRNSSGVNAVSKIHRRVSQKMFSNLMPGFP